MGIQYTGKKIHWNLFLALEREFEIVARYIEPCEKNNDTYSIELARLLMSASQEVDVVLKALCQISCAGANAKSIGAYYSCIRESMPDFFNVEVEISHYGMRSMPFYGWSEDSPPEWWTANNKVKHHRNTDFNKATLKNTYNSLAALQIAIIHLYKIELEQAGENNEWIDVTKALIPIPNLFLPTNGYYQLSNDVGTF